MLYLAIRNVQRNKWESILSITLVVLTVAMFVVGIFTMSMMDKGLNSSSKRLGADILVMPHTAQVDAQQTLFTAAPENIYMDEKVFKKVKEIQGVEKASPQFFTQTLNESCCSVVGAKRLVGYDPETDFVISPWLKQRQNDQNLKKDEVIVGSSLPNFLGGKVAILGKPFSVVDILGKTDTCMDETLFVNIYIARKLAKNSPYLQNLWKTQNPDRLISAVMVKATEGINPSVVAERINKDVSGVHAMVAGNVIQGLRVELRTFQRILLFIFVVIFFITSLAMFARFVSIAEQRIQELGLIRALGGTKCDSAKAILFEIAIIVLSGGLLGSIVGIAGGIYSYQWLVAALKLPVSEFSVSTIFLFGGLGIVISLLLGIISAWFPILRNLFKDPIEILTRSKV